MNKTFNFDPFGVQDQFTLAENKPEELQIHIHVQQRTARAMTTTVIGFPRDYDLKGLVKKIRKKYCCSGFIADDPKATDPRFSKVLRFTGDHRTNISDFLAASEIVKEENIKIHGY